jgi:cytochrome b pre-mRNA-processing protein 3
MGVGDTTVPKRMKRFAEAFYGRARAYDEALASDDPAGLQASLSRNVLRPGVPAAGLARYTVAAERALAALPLDAFMREDLRFPAPDAAMREEP